MTGIWWATVRLAAKGLEPDEREAVCGDLEEIGASGPRALHAVAGLVIRRFAFEWLTWRPWLSLATVAVPLGILLSFASRWWADTTAIDAFLYIENWTSAYLDSSGARGDLFAAGGRTLLLFAGLAAWSWIVGLALASLSARTSRTTWAVFALVVCAATVGTMTVARGPHNAAVFTTTFYGVIWPMAVRVGLVLLPAWFAVRRQRVAPVRWLDASIALLLVTFLMVAMAPGIEGALTFGSGGAVARPDPGHDGIMGNADDGHPLQPLVMVALVWPGLIVLAAAARRQTRVMGPVSDRGAH